MNIQAKQHETDQAIAMLTRSVEHLTHTCLNLFEIVKNNGDTIAALSVRVSDLEERERYTGHE